LGIAYLTEISAVWVFLTGAIAIAVLSDWMRRATEQIADYAGGTIGGLLNVTFGSIAELVLALFVLREGHADVVQAQIIGSIIGTSLLGLGLALLVGGWGRISQSFDRGRVGLLSTMLIIVMIALLLPAVFDLAQRAPGPLRGLTDEQFSLAASVVLLAVYAGNMVFTLMSRSGQPEEPQDRQGDRQRDPRRDRQAEQQGSGWGLSRAILVLLGCTVLVAMEAELVSNALMDVMTVTGLSPMFMGVIVLALIGTVSDLLAAVVFARQDDMTIAFSLCIGSAIQVALVVAPVLVLLSWLMGSPMNLVMGSPLDLFAIAGTAFIVRAIAADGETNWFEGLLLIGVYALLALAWFFDHPA
jgi:Ca2+:H+ antiporter